MTTINDSKIRSFINLGLEESADCQQRQESPCPIRNTLNRAVTSTKPIESNLLRALQNTANVCATVRKETCKTHLLIDEIVDYANQME